MCNVLYNFMRYKSFFSLAVLHLFLYSKKVFQVRLPGLITKRLRWTKIEKKMELKFLRAPRVIVQSNYFAKEIETKLGKCGKP